MEHRALKIAAAGAFFVFAMSAIVTPICLVDISISFKTDLGESGGLETSRTLTIVAVLLGSGLLARKIGKKRLLTPGLYLLSLGLFVASLSQNYLQLLVALLIAGAGGGFVEALVNPLVQDLYGSRSDRFLNIYNGFYPVGIVIPVLLFGELLTRGVSWRIMYAIAGGLSLVMAVLMSFSRSPVPSEETEGWQPYRKILARRWFWLFAAVIFLGAGVESGFTFWIATYIQVYHVDIPRAGALGTAIFALFLALGRMATGGLAAKMGLRKIMFASSLLGFVAGILMMQGWPVVAAYFILAFAGISAAPFWASVLSVAAGVLKTGSTRLFVLLSCAGIAGYGTTPWIMGIIGDKSGLKSGFIVIPILFFGLLVVLAVEYVHWRKISHTNP